MKTPIKKCEKCGYIHNDSRPCIHPKENERVVRNIMSGEHYVEDKDTPFCCSVASESYWSS